MFGCRRLAADLASRRNRASRSGVSREPGLATLSARYAGVDVTIDLCAVPEEADCVFVVNVHSGERWAVPAGRVQLLRISRALAV